MSSSYQALARSFRPQTFSDYVGQEHATKAIKNALSNQKLHHAYLFTGTRGVGKTSLARLFAKALCCMQGVSANPCNKCNHCSAITQGRFLDLIEIDAASRTKVEDTRELLAQVDYPPSIGAFKIYIIDEVHMLSTHSFNALLKTLEEPPAHIKFILATTDPEKVPVTVQSRCLQFHLKHMDESMIAARFAHVLKTLAIEYDQEAITSLAKAANGSLRDGLTLLEQALSLGDTQLTQDQVATMLGSLSEVQIYDYLKHIYSNNREQTEIILNNFRKKTIRYPQLLDHMLRIGADISHAHVFSATPYNEHIQELASLISPDDCQTMLEMIVHSKKTLEIYPDQYMAFRILTIRLLACRIQNEGFLNSLPTLNQDNRVDPATLSASERPVLAPPRKPSSHETASKLQDSHQPPAPNLTQAQQHSTPPSASSATSPHTGHSASALLKAAQAKKQEKKKPLITKTADTPDTTRKVTPKISNTNPPAESPVLLTQTTTLGDENLVKHTPSSSPEDSVPTPNTLDTQPASHTPKTHTNTVEGRKKQALTEAQESSLLHSTAKTLRAHIQFESLELLPN